jgi:hypothetical protein
MKIVVAYGGLGNVMFQYALVCAFRAKSVRGLLFVADVNVEHNGYELEKVFPDTSQWRTLNQAQIAYYRILQSLRNLGKGKRHFPHKILFYPFKNNHYGQSPVNYHPQVFENMGSNDFYVGHFQSYKYFQDYEPLIRDEFKFDINKLTQSTKDVAAQINSCNGVSIHVRRGDYMNKYYYNMLGSVCNFDYYQRAIDYISKNVDNPRFFIFSDDQEYVKDNLKIDNAIYVNINSGDNSWQDMYLMSQCHHNIIANSTFSWWGAWLNNNTSKIVVAPSRWFADYENDEIIPYDWIRL